jgi:hypothetical protein
VRESKRIGLNIRRSNTRETAPATSVRGMTSLCHTSYIIKLVSASEPSLTATTPWFVHFHSLFFSFLLNPDFQSDSDSPRSPSRTSAVAKSPAGQIRYVFSFENLSLVHFDNYSRRAGGSQVAKPNSTRAAGAGGSSNTMLKLYTDDSPGLRVSVHPISATKRQLC